MPDAGHAAELAASIDNRHRGRSRLDAVGIIVHLMREVEELRRRYEPAPRNPFPALSGDEILSILHPHDGDRPCQRR